MRSPCDRQLMIQTVCYKEELFLCKNSKEMKLDKKIVAKYDVDRICREYYEC